MAFLPLLEYSGSELASHEWVDVQQKCYISERGSLLVQFMEDCHLCGTNAVPKQVWLFIKWTRVEITWIIHLDEIEQIIVVLTNFLPQQD